MVAYAAEIPTLKASARRHSVHAHFSDKKKKKKIEIKYEMMRSMLLTLTLFFFIACQKQDNGNQLPLESVPGKILFTTATDLVELDIQSGATKVIARRLGMFFPAWSPDGAKLMWSDSVNAQGAGIIKVADDAGNLVLTFNNPDIHDPCWSPDGSRLAFFNLEKKIVTKITLATQAKDSFALLAGNQFWQQSSPDWSPDGSAFVFQALNIDRNVQELWRVGVNGQGLDMIGEGTYPRWSPDGKEIAYVWKGSVRTFDTTNGPGRLLIESGNTPHWSADGKLMMYSFERESGVGAKGYDIRARNLETGQERLIHSGAQLIDWYSGS